MRCPGARRAVLVVGLVELRGGVRRGAQADDAATALNGDALALREGVRLAALAALRVGADLLGEGAVGGEGDGHKGEKDECGLHDDSSFMNLRERNNGIDVVKVRMRLEGEQGV